MNHSAFHERIPETAAHPERREIEEFLRGGGTDPDWLNQMETHLEWCDECQGKGESDSPGPLELLIREAAKEKPNIRICEGFDIIEQAGRGATGIVYRAVQSGLGREVALKLLISEFGKEPADLARFHRESAALARLDHPNIVTIHDVGDQDGVPYIVMEWIEGTTLAEFLRLNDSSYRQIAEILLALAQAMQHAHNHNVMHRDLKPQNILVSKGQPKIVDFGLACFCEDDVYRTKTGATLGTPSYAAPEQLNGQSKTFGAETDVYGLGAVLFEALTGCPPFQGDSALNVIQQVLSHEPESIRKINPSVPKDLATICHRCLNKNRDARFSSAAHLAGDLQRFLDGRSIQSRPATAWERSIRWARRNPWPVALTAILISALITIVVIQRSHQVRLADERDQVKEDYQNARTTIWRMLDSIQSDAGFDIPQLNELRDAQTEAALELFEDLAEADQSPAAQVDKARIEMRLGSILLGSGKLTEGREMLDRAKSGFQRIINASPEHVTAIEGLIGSEVKIAIALSSTNQNEKAKELLQAIMPLAKQLRDRFPDQPSHDANVAWIHHNLGNVFTALAQYQEAQFQFEAAIEILQRIFKKYDDPTSCQRRLAEAQVGVGLCQMARQDPRADQSYMEAISTMQRILDAQPRDIDTMYAIAIAQLNRSIILAGRDEAADAVSACNIGIELLEKAVAAAPDVAHYRDTLAMLHGNRATFRTSADNNGLWIANANDWQKATEFSHEPATKHYCQIMHVRTLADLNELGKAIQIAKAIQTDELDDSNLFYWTSCWGLITNRCASNKEEAKQSARLNDCLQHVRKGLNELRNRGLIEAPTISDAIRSGSDFQTFRNSADATELAELVKAKQ